jgi:hypothetical protein
MDPSVWCRCRFPIHILVVAMDGACLRPAFAPISAPNHPMAPDAGWFPRENKDKEYRLDTITPI